MSGDDGRN